MSNIEILMPALSPTMEEGGIAKWLVKPGDTIRAGDLIAEIETDKAIMEFESASDGIICELLVEEGSNQIKVNTPIALISDESISTKGRNVTKKQTNNSSSSNTISPSNVLTNDLYDFGIRTKSFLVVTSIDLVRLAVSAKFNISFSSKIW